ncbi:alpha/beta superfamily hydrolase [Xylariales sp. AK1849]|nr:alpha/beta superfamily hydrolase [Xylariales sp. AK1849]
MPTSRRDIEFKTTDQVALRGWFYPAGPRAPTIILTHGLTGIKELCLDSFASCFQAAGLAVLVYDNRNFGQSGGLPRFEVDAFKQVEDYHDAITYVETLTDAVDPERVAVWGTSYSGGNVLQAAAVDRRIKAVIAQVPFVSGHSNAPALMSLMPTIVEDRAQLAAGAEGAETPVVAPSLTEAGPSAQAILPEADAYQFFAQTPLPDGVKWENRMTLQSLFKLLKNEPRAYVRRISPTPLLMVVAEDDTAVDVPTQLATFGEAGSPKELFFMAKTGHFEPYSGEAFERNIERQIAFLKKYLLV